MDSHHASPERQPALPFTQLTNEPPSLVGQYVRLAPLALEHADALGAAAGDGELWQLPYTVVPRPEAMRKEIERRLALQRMGSMVPFAVLEAASGDAVGMTTFLNIDAANRRLELGSTWYARRVQRTPLNTEAKLLLLTHAFERLGSIAVELRAHWLNQASRRAIERMGAKLDGILRSHQILPDGALRDTCVYSIVAAEWPAVRTHLRFQLEQQP